MEKMTEVLQLAESFISAGIVLLAHRSGQAAMFPALWSEGAAHITANMTPRDDSAPFST